MTITNDNASVRAAMGDAVGWDSVRSVKPDSALSLLMADMNSLRAVYWAAGAHLAVRHPKGAFAFLAVSVCTVGGRDRHRCLGDVRIGGMWVNGRVVGSVRPEGHCIQRARTRGVVGKVMNLLKKSLREMVGLGT
jgi:hypothetical protein